MHSLQPLTARGGSPEGTRRHAQGQIALWEGVCLEQRWHVSCHPAGLGPVACLSLSTGAAMGRGADRSRSECRGHAPVQGCPGPCLPLWGLPATPEPAARLSRLQGFGVTLSSVSFPVVFREPRAQEHTQLQHNTPSSPGA